jgi:hypothetical protein
VVCPLCGQRKARRTCPALGHQICATCCGTKRLVQIKCPSDCPYLATAREHPPAAVARRQQHDLQSLVHFMRDFNQRQSQLFFLVNTFLVRHNPPELQPLIDDDAAEAAEALAATLETSARGVIYEHHPASLPAERLAVALKPLLAEAGGPNAGTAFERDAAFVLRRIAEAARAVRASDEGNRRAFLDLLGRMIKREAAEATNAEPQEAPRLILP